VDRREREAILGEHAPRPATALEERQARRLEADLAGSPLRGRPLPSRLRNFRPAIESYVAGLHGPPAHVRRLAEIETLTAEHEDRLRARWEELAATRPDPVEFARQWHAVSRRWNFGDVNELIDRHNRFYPTEARLPMDPRTGDFVLVGGRPFRRRLLDAGWILERLPAARETLAA
jgi:hypothetical protein